MVAGISDASHEIEIKEMIGSIKRISSLPDVFAKVNELLNDPRSSAVDIGKAISGDQALTARLLWLVNSAFYGFPNKIDTVTRALTIIGFRQIRELILATSVLGMFKDMGGSTFNMESFWQHSLACGVVCRVLAIYRRERNPESYFVAGLLHDIGRLILLESYRAEYMQVFYFAKDEEKFLWEIEQEVFGFDHATVGKELVSFWKLPSSLGDGVAFHHNPKACCGTSNYGDMVHVGDIIASALRFGSSGERFVPPLESAAWENIGLKKSVLESAMDKIFEQYEQATKFLLVNNQQASKL